MKIVIWFQVDKDAWFGGQGRYLKPAIKTLASLYGSIEAVGMIDSGKNFSSSHDKKWIDLKDLNSLDYDLIVVSGNPKTLVPVWESTKEFGVPSEKIILDRTICTHGFSLRNYRKLCCSRLSILAMNCWGGLMFSILGLRYNSPTVNMRTDTEDEFMEFLKDPVRNVEAQPEFVRMEKNKKQIPYPVFRIGVTEWHMTHYNLEDVSGGGLCKGIRINKVA